MTAQLLTAEQRRKRDRGYQQTFRTKHRDARNTYHCAWRAVHPEAMLLNNARNRAKRLRVPCTLTVADVRGLLAPMRCTATGLPLTRNTGGGHSDALSPSLDRIVPALGYVPGNVRLVCHRFNALRGTDPVSQDYRHALRVLVETSHTTDRQFTNE